MNKMIAVVAMAVIAIAGLSFDRAPGTPSRPVAPATCQVPKAWGAYRGELSSVARPASALVFEDRSGTLRVVGCVSEEGQVFPLGQVRLEVRRR